MRLALQDFPTQGEVLLGKPTQLGQRDLHKHSWNAANCASRAATLPTEKNERNWLRLLLVTRKRLPVSAKNMKQTVLHILQVIEDK